MSQRKKCSKAPDRGRNPQSDFHMSDDRRGINDWLRLDVVYVSVGDLKPLLVNPRKHPKKQIKKLAKAIREFGFVVPILINSEGHVIAGDARVAAADHLGMRTVPAVRIDHLSDEQVRAFRIFDNRIAEDAEWDFEALAVEFQGLVEIDFDLDLTGFEIPEIDRIIDEQLAPVASGPGDAIPPVSERPVARLGDVWRLDEHRVICGDAREVQTYQRLLGSNLAQMVLTDPPYNVRIEDVVGLGKTKHREFVMASGGMSDDEFQAFLNDTITSLIPYTVDRSVHFLFMDWRHIGALEAVCRQHYSEHLNTCVWVKTNGGMGSLYRSQHEFVLVFKNGTGPHINNIQLGKYGRNRTNVWRYAGVNSLDPDRRADLALHPTVKPVAMIADAIKDCSKRGGIVLDPFLGSGTTIIACEDTGRVAYGSELDPLYVDVIIRRWEAYTQGQARHADTGLTFAEMADIRLGRQRLLPPPRKVDA